MLTRFKNAIVLGVLLFSFTAINAQNVGINSAGSAPDASAGLDVNFTNKGVLIPRVALTGTGDVSTISSPLTSLLVYNTATAGTSPTNVYPGYYYFDGANWDRMITDRNRTILSGNITNNNVTANTIADVTGLSFAVASGVKYKFKFYITYTSAATTTGARFCINGPTVTSLFYSSMYPSSTTAMVFNNSLTTFNVPAAAAGGSGTNSNVAIIEGIITPSAAGTVIARFASEITNSAIVALGGFSYVEWEVLQ